MITHTDIVIQSKFTSWNPSNWHDDYNNFTDINHARKFKSTLAAQNPNQEFRIITRITTIEEQVDNQ